MIRWRSTLISICSVMGAISIGVGFGGDTEQAYADEEPLTFDCVQSFEYFAYGIPEDFTEADQLDVMWIPQYELPDTNEESETFSFLDARALFSRTINGEMEIWLNISTSANPYHEEPVFGVFRVADGFLTLVPRRMRDSFSIANELTVDNNGAIWATANQYAPERYIILPGADSPYPSDYASIATYDEVNKHFVPIAEAPEIPFQPDTRVHDPLTQLVMDSSGTLWVFLSGEDIYRFDPTTRTFPLVQKLDGTRFGTATPTLDGSMMTSLHSTSATYVWGEVLSVEDYVFEIFPITGRIQSVPPPPIPLSSGLQVLVDQDNRVWFSATAYLADGQWTVVNPDPDRTQNMLSQIQFPTIWTFPTPILSDSSGRIWFVTTGDTSYGTTGTAWFDPATGNGCRFSNAAINIIEDEYGYLWLFDSSRRTLYRSAERTE